MPKNHLHKEQHRSNRYAEPAHQEMPLQEEMPLQQELQQTEEQRNAPAAGEAVAQRMAERLPLGGEGPEPPDPPQMPPQEETAPRTKREKKLLRQRQEEQRRQEEEQARQRADMQRREEAARRRRLEELERQRQEDEERMEEARRKANRNILFENDHVRELLVDLVSETDAQKAVEKAQAFIQAAGDHLFSRNEELADAYGITADYASEIKKFNALIATQVEDQDTARQLIERAKGHKERFTQLAHQRSVVSFANNGGGILDLMKEECMNNEALERILSKAAFRMSESYDSDMSIQRAIWDEYEGVVARNVHMPITADRINVFASGSPYRYLTKQETQEKFDRRIAELMHQDPQLSEEEAELRVYAEHKQELEEQAKERTMHSGIVSGVSAEDWARHGGASEHYTLPASQAYKIVESSKGFLYAKPVSNGLCELRPTLPETVEIGDEKIPLRRCYTLFVKAMMWGAFDENGELKQGKPGEISFADDVSYCLSIVGRQDPERSLPEDLKRLLGGPLEEILGGDAQQVEETLQQIHKLMTTSSEMTFPPNEIMQAFAESIYRLESAGDGATLAVQFDSFRKELEKRNTPPEEIEKIMAAQKNPALVKRVWRMKESFLGEGKEGPLTKEQSEEIQAVYSLYADLDTAMREMMAIRNMDPDSPDVPLPNACSAHASFIAGIRKDWFKDDAPQFRYDVENHLVAHPLEHIDYCLKHLDADKKADILKKVDAMSQRLQTLQEQGKTPLLTPEEQIYLSNLTIAGGGAPSKYIYHEMANLGKTKDGMSITSEGFAAETKQYMVSPFSRKHSVGLYRGSDEYIPATNRIINSGAVAYYNHDNPLPEEKDILLADLKLKMCQNKLPGGAI